MPKGSKALVKCNICTVGHFKDWKPTQISQWITGCGGRHTSRLNRETTHLVISSDKWRSEHELVKKAKEMNPGQGKGGVQIVSWDWLEDSVMNRTRRPEGTYLWAKLEPNAKARKKVQKVQVNSSSDADESDTEIAAPKGAKNGAGMLREVFEDSTNRYVSAKENEKIKRQAAVEKQVREQIARDEERRRKTEEEAKRFEKGAKKARNEIFSENHHIFTDETGFKYDITLTKVDTKYNRNERHVITIYESNASPPTYATNAQFAGTAVIPSNTIIAAIGCPFPTALRAFKKIFKEKTRVEWDDRIEIALARRKKRGRRDSAVQIDNTDAGSRQGSTALRGVPVGTPESSQGQGTKDGKAPVEEDFKTAPFEYDPPKYGPVGILSATSDEKVKEWMGKTADAAPAGVPFLSGQHMKDQPNGSKKAEVINIDDEYDEDNDQDPANGDGQNHVAVAFMSGGFGDQEFDFSTPAPDLDNGDQASVFDSSLTDILCGDYGAPVNNIDDVAATGFGFTSNHMGPPLHGANRFSATTPLHMTTPFSWPAGSMGNQNTFNNEWTSHLFNDQNMHTSFPLGSGTEGETQLAEQAQDELIDFMTGTPAVNEMVPSEANDERTPGQPSNQSNGSVNSHSLDLGSSIFSSQGKRKATASPPDDLVVEDGQPPSKKSKQMHEGDENAPGVEVADSFGASENSYTLATANDGSLRSENRLPGGNAVPRSFIQEDEEEIARAADEQLQMESQLAIGEAAGGTEEVSAD